MIIKRFYNGIEVHRGEKIIVIRFLLPHRVISTCRANGGLRDDLELIFNHQSCEPTGHKRRLHAMAVREPATYLRNICAQHDLPENCACLGTAANMNCAAVSSEAFRDLEVVAICTGGVETNAGRAGDPACFYETGKGFESIGGGPKGLSGTINIMICINRELTPGAMVRAVMTATEAKTAILQELSVGSRYSDGLATGTGTDQIAIACALTEEPPLTGAGKHVKLGELLGIAVKNAVRKTLELQNGMTPQSRCSVLVHIERLGADIDSMQAGIKRYLPAGQGELLSKNFGCIDRDPITVAAVAALVHLKDKLGWHILPEGCVPEIFSTYGAHLAAAVSGKYDRFVSYKDRLDGRRFSLENKAFLDFVYYCMAMGFEEKWDNSGNGGTAIV